MFLMEIENGNEEIVLLPYAFNFSFAVVLSLRHVNIPLSTCCFCPVAIIPSSASKMQTHYGICARFIRLIFATRANVKEIFVTMVHRYINFDTAWNTHDIAAVSFSSTFIGLNNDVCSIMFGK